MPTVAAGIDFDHVAREWRMKYTEDGDKASATAAMAVLSEHLATIKAVAGVTAVTRTVCGKGTCVSKSCVRPVVSGAGVPSGLRSGSTPQHDYC